MKFSVRFLRGQEIPAFNPPAWETNITPAQQVRAMQLAEELGYWKIGCPEHFVTSTDHRELSGDHHLHAATALAFAAGATKTIKVGSQVTLLPLVHPIAQAKIWATLDWVSGGRAVLLAGVGWQAEEFEMMGVPFEQRGALCDEYVAAMIELWTSDHPSFEGRYVKFHDVGAAPKPIQGKIPLWFGGDAPATLRRVARWGAGWSPRSTRPEDIPVRLDQIRQHPDYAGQPIGLYYSLAMLNIAAGRDRHARVEDVRAEPTTNAAELIDRLNWLASLGVTDTFLPRPPLRDFEAYLDWLRWVAAEVMPKVQ
jgi:probable F420-dependent oxidoreductase